MGNRHIVVRPEDIGTGYEIHVEPAPEWTCYNARRPTHRDAIRYARSLNVVHGWKVVDRAGAATE